ARHREEPLEDAADDRPDPESVDPPSGATLREGVSGPGSWPLNRRAPAAQTQVPIAPPTSNTPGAEPRMGARGSLPLWTPPLLWYANGRYIHRHDCDHMTRGESIAVWSEDGAYHWAQERNLSGCLYCRPFDKPEPVLASQPEVTG
ncbi:MAG: hypothetical protein ACRD0W_25895, partial [Acidimicrobiales bacterium]